jgi:PAS domain S-box-containing protein
MPTWTNIISLIGVLGGLSVALVGILKYKQERRAAVMTMTGERYARIIEELYAGLIVVDADDIIIVANETARLVSGYKDLLGMNYIKLVPERFRERHARHVANYRHNPYPRPMGRNLDLWLLTRSGAEVPVLLTLKAIESVEVGGMMEIIVGITAKDSPVAGHDRREGDGK